MHDSTHGEFATATTNAAAVAPAHHVKKVENVRVGQRLVAHNPDAADEEPGSTAVDPSTWRRLRLHSENRWPDGTLDTIEIETLQPPEWLAVERVDVGREVSIPLDLVEMGLPEEMTAHVVSIGPCPPIEGGAGQVVLTTVNHLNNDVYELTIEDTSGIRETVHPTGSHKMYSAARGWVSAGELEPGERLGGLSELRVVGGRPLPGVHRVYNFTVEGQHVYHVGVIGALAHNTCPGFSNPALGNLVHSRFKKVLVEQTGTKPRDWVMRTKVGMKGVDATYIGPRSRYPGFRHAELKPKSDYSFGVFLDQLGRWRHPKGSTQLWFYNEQGVIGSTGINF